MDKETWEKKRKFRRIMNVQCPICGKDMQRRFNDRRESEFHCINCVYYYLETWFDTFRQHEDLVTRQGDIK